MRAVIMKSLALPILYPSWLMTVASMRDVDILDISAGWKRIPPKSNHDRDPLTSTPRNMTATSSPMTNRYIGRDSPSYIRGLRTNSIMTAMTSEVPIHMACMPLRQLVSKIDEGSADCTEA